MQEVEKEKKFDVVYTITLLLKLLTAGLEILGSFVVLFITHHVIYSTVSYMTADELSEDPHDLIARTILEWSRDISLSHHTFAFVYLFTHGLVKVILIMGLLKKKLWAFKFGIVFFIIFIFYELYRFTLTRSLWLLLLCLFDALVLSLIIYQYRHFKRV